MSKFSFVACTTVSCFNNAHPTHVALARPTTSTTKFRLLIRPSIVSRNQPLKVRHDEVVNVRGGMKLSFPYDVSSQMEKILQEAIDYEWANGPRYQAHNGFWWIMLAIIALPVLVPISIPTFFLCPLIPFFIWSYPIIGICNMISIETSRGAPANACLDNAVAKCRDQLLQLARTVHPDAEIAYTRTDEMIGVPYPLSRGSKLEYGVIIYSNAMDAQTMMMMQSMNPQMQAMNMQTAQMMNMQMTQNMQMAQNNAAFNMSGMQCGVPQNAPTFAAAPNMTANMQQMPMPTQMPMQVTPQVTPQVAPQMEMAPVAPMLPAAQPLPAAPNGRYVAEDDFDAYI